MIPQLQVLDSIPVDQNAKTKVSNGMILEAASVMQLEQEELDDERRMEMAILGDEFNTAMGYNSQYDTIKTETNNLNNLTKTQGIIPDTGSDLTHGSNVVLAGMFIHYSYYHHYSYYFLYFNFICIIIL